MDRAHMERAIKMFPVLGLLQGVLYAILLYLFLEWTPFSVLSIAFFIWLSHILITGGIHLDGWMDASDAFFSYRDQQKRLEIMKDPRIGAFGVLSVIVLLSARFLFLYEIIQFTTISTFFLIALIPFISKCVMGVLLLKVKAAKEDGLGSLFKNAANPKTLWIYPLYVGILFFLAYQISLEALLGAILLMLVGIIFILIVKRKIIKWFGGITGDVLGASVEGMEMVLWLTLWLWHYFAMV